MKPAVTFRVLGRPQPGGSKTPLRTKSGKLYVKDSNPRVMPWRDSVAASAQRAMDGRPLLAGPLAVKFTFYVARPQGHYRTGKHSGEVKASAPERPVVRPDVTKLIRSVEDACTSVVWRDDSQIVTQIGRKLYGTPEGVQVEVHCRDSNDNGGHDGHS